MEFQDFPGIQGESPCTGLYAGWWLSLPPTPLKNHGVSSSVGMMTFPTVSGEIPNMFQTTNQSLYVISLYIYIYIYHISHQISLLWLAINPIYYGKIKVMFHVFFPFPQHILCPVGKTSRKTAWLVSPRFSIEPWCWYIYLQCEAPQ